MTSSDFIESKAFKNRVDSIVSMANETLDRNIIVPLISSTLLESFNDGIMANMSERTRVSRETLLKKSKEVTKFLPAHFKNTETGKKLVDIMLKEIMNNCTDYVLNIGYEQVLTECINTIVRIAYSVGITTGFEIASDPDLKKIYTANVERFLKSGEIRDAS